MVSPTFNCNRCRLLRRAETPPAGRSSATPVSSIFEPTDTNRPRLRGCCLLDEEDGVALSSGDTVRLLRALSRLPTEGFFFFLSVSLSPYSPSSLPPSPSCCPSSLSSTMSSMSSSSSSSASRSSSSPSLVCCCFASSCSSLPFGFPPADESSFCFRFLSSFSFFNSFARKRSTALIASCCSRLSFSSCLFFARSAACDFFSPEWTVGALAGGSTCCDCSVAGRRLLRRVGACVS
mmetsp:Transcript_5248/g.8643  ORF Transcript_5248/g.8643 Transcript_5248/m.8643 type:complete len:235 (+) Transcript_5248:441-1145(+)